jgi:hypothetical protein
MEIYSVRRCHGRHCDVEISTLFWGALIFLALFVSCLLAWKAIEWLRNRREFDGGAVEGGHTKDPRVAQTLADVWHWDHRSGMVSMTPRETDEFPLIDRTRKQRKAIKERQRAREQAQKRGKGRN